VAEAEIRRWLSEFLPKRYGVTSGYIISPGFSTDQKAPHFDVIIYEHLESPVLWVDNNPDDSRQGRSLALPVEYVRGVLEIKSQMSTSTMREALEHLYELLPVLQDTDEPGQRYKLYLPPSFFCGVAFVDLKVENANSPTLLPKLIDGIGLRGFIGGIVLRGEGHTLPHTGRLQLMRSETPIEGSDPKKIPLLESGWSQSKKLAEKVNIGASLIWSEPTFAQFAFDLVALLGGTYEIGRMSSFYGLGSTWQEIAKPEQR
jgi:hypothetical protein